MTGPTPAEKLVEEVARAICTYQNGTLDCAGRGDGYLWDADGDGYDPSDVTYPCPACNTREFLDTAVERASGWSSYQFIYTSGAEHWRRATEIALEANPDAATAALNDIGPVDCDEWANPDAPNVNEMVTVWVLPSSAIRSLSKDQEHG